MQNHVVEVLEERALLTGYGDPEAINLYADDVSSSSRPDEFLTHNGLTYFAATALGRGNELWVTDGTDAGTRLLRDIRPGTQSSLPRDLTAFGNHVYFTADRGSGRELWSTDGTESGTRLQNSSGVTAVSNLRFAANQIFFTGRNNTFGGELWRVGFPGGGPTLVADLNPGVFNSDIRFDALAEKDGFLYFGANGDLYRTTGSGATLINDDMFTIYSIVNVDGTLYIDAEGLAGKGLFTSDGTDAGTGLIRDIRGNFNSHTTLGYMTPSPTGSGILFEVGTPQFGSELWSSDGTGAGTNILKDIRPGTTGSFPGWNPDATLNGELYFYANDGTTGGELWRTDGTTAGTELVVDTTPGVLGGVFNFPETFGSHIYFNGGRSGALAGLWRTDGTTTGRFLEHFSTDSLYAGNGLLWFGADDGTHGTEPWTSDGSLAGTGMFRNLSTVVNSSNPNRFIAHDGKLFFQAEDADGTELWSTDGATTAQVLDIEPGSDSSQPYQLTSVGDTLFFTADESSTGRELWMSDGTAAGTSVIDINPGANDSYPNDLIGAGGLLFFAAETPAAGYEAYATDGTTVTLLDLVAGSDSSDPYDFMALGNRAFFIAETPVAGYELWVSDGTVGGTNLVKDINPSGDGADSILGIFDGELFFSANDGVHGYELWKSDGTEAGTVLVGDFIPGNEDLSPWRFADLGDHFLFNGAPVNPGNDEGYDSLWRSDGTAAGTVVIAPGMSMYDNIVLDGVAYFDGESDEESGGLWRSDGTTDGTRHLHDLPGSAQDVNVMGDHVIFSAWDGQSSHVFSTNGSRSSLKSLSKSLDSGFGFGPVGDDLYFYGERPDIGQELFRVTPMTAPGVSLFEPLGTTQVDTLSGTDQFFVVLDDAPTSDVVLNVSTDSEFIQINAATLTFTPANWDQPQAVIVVGPADPDVAEEGGLTEEIKLAINPALSNDAWDAVADTIVPVDVLALPETRFDYQETDETTPVTFDPTANDTPSMGIDVLAVRNADYGTFEINADNSLTFTPDGSSTGFDEFGYDGRVSQTSTDPSLQALQARFGHSIAVDHDLAVVGAPRENHVSGPGAAYVMQRVGSEWVERAKLVPSTEHNNNSFGRSVAIQGRRVFVGTPRDNELGQGAGAVFVFEPNSSGDWVETARITDPTGRPKDDFGHDVAIDDDTLVVGARLDDGRGTNSGSVFVFDLNVLTGEWEFVKRIKASDAFAKQQIGFSVDIDGDTIVSGAYKHDGTATDSGAVYVFGRDVGGPDQWGEVALLKAPNPQLNDWFGHDVAIQGGTLVVGSPRKNVDGVTNTGSVYIFENDGGWSLTQTLTETKLQGGSEVFSGSHGDFFGNAVDVSDEFLLVGSKLDDGRALRNSGSAYLFVTGDGGWEPHETLKKFKARDAAKYDEFGSSVALTNTTGSDPVMVIGAAKTDDVNNASGRMYAEYSSTVRGNGEIFVGGGEELHAAFLGSGHVDTLNSKDLEPVVQQAIDLWKTGLLTSDETDALNTVTFEITDLGATTLGRVRGTHILIDDDAAGHGWSVNQSPTRIDLLTVVAHELGHVLDHKHGDEGLMEPTIAPGDRDLHMPNALDHVFRELDLMPM